jgi:disulfide bond formation protein DsbB
MFRRLPVTGLLAALTLLFVAACGQQQEAEETSEPIEPTPIEVTVEEQQPTPQPENTTVVEEYPEPQDEPTEEALDPYPEGVEATEEPAEVEPTEEPAEVEPTEEPAPEGDAVVGETLFQNTCAACHGSDAKGLPGLGKDLTTSEFVKGLSDAELVAFITEGRPVDDPANTRGVAMPPKGGNPALTDEDLFDIVAYIRTLEE